MALEDSRSGQHFQAEPVDGPRIFEGDVVKKTIL